MAEHDYPYEVHEISEAYNYLLLHLFDDEGENNGSGGPKIRWNAPVNANAFTGRTVSDMMNNACLGLLNFDKGVENPFEVTG